MRAERACYFCALPGLPSSFGGDVVTEENWGHESEVSPAAPSWDNCKYVGDHFNIEFVRVVFQTCQDKLGWNSLALAEDRIRVFFNALRKLSSKKCTISFLKV